MEIENVRSFGIEDQSDWEFPLIFLLPHLPGDIITMAKLITESVTIRVQKETALTAESLCGQKLPFGAGVFGINKTGWMNLHLVHVNTIAANSHNHLLSITGGVDTIS